MTSPSGRALRPTAHLGEDGTRHHRPLHSETAHRAHAAEPAGASVLRGIEGFGAFARIHPSRRLPLNEDPPVAAVVVGAVDPGGRKSS